MVERNSRIETSGKSSIAGTSNCKERYEHFDSVKAEKPDNGGHGSVVNMISKVKCFATHAFNEDLTRRYLNTKSPDLSKFEKCLVDYSDECRTELKLDGRSPQSDMQTCGDYIPDIVLDESDWGERFKRFEEWLLANGAKLSNMYLKTYTGDIRGIHTRVNVSTNDLLIEIPLKCLITDNMGRTETSIGRKLFAKKNSLSAPNLIAVIIYIMTTRSEKNHFFEPYYDILPDDFTNFPIFWSAEELEWLSGSSLLDDIVKRKQNILADYEEICDVCPEFSRYSFEDFLRVRTAVGSRNFGIVIHGNKRTAMVPYADMLNHYRPRETNWTYNNLKDAFTVSALTSMNAGQQVMDSYGKKCNGKFLLHYGFAVECNREADGRCQNEVQLGLSVPSTLDTFLERTRSKLFGKAFRSKKFSITMNADDRGTCEAISFARVAVATADEVRQICDRFSISNVKRMNSDLVSSSQLSRSPWEIAFVSSRNELAALGLLAQACKTKLKGYPQTYEQNKNLILNGKIPSFSTRRSALVVVLGEQEICNFWIDAQKFVESLLVNEFGNTEDEWSIQNYHAIRMAVCSLPRTTFRDMDLARLGERLCLEIRDTVS